MNTINPHKVAEAICLAIDVDIQRASSVTIRLTRSVAVIEVGYFLFDRHGEDMAEVIKRYDFVERAA